jgi:class 3 adenylate cyclase/tetratricopeptide (TPR) repeat protein
MICLNCRTENSERATSCAQCGVPLSRRAIDSGAASFYGERRQLTALFCDIVGSTELAAALDPEEYHEIVRAFAHCCRGVVDRFGGHVKELRGDGALVFFGYPQARGDEPERAMRTALHVIDAIGKLTFPRGHQLRVRIGIATGLMAIDVGADHEPSIVGEALNLAMRLQGLAEPNAIVMSDLTKQLAGNLFVLTDLGLHRVKGYAQPVPAWRVVGPKKLASQFDALHLRGLTNFVGREKEMKLLLRCWDRARQGNGQIVTVSGEAGIGKSRLIKQLRDAVAPEGRMFEYFGSEYHTNTAFHPIIEQVARSSGVGIEESPEARLEALRRMLERIAGDYQVHLPWIAALASLPAKEMPAAVSPEQRKHKTFDAILWWLAAVSQKKPLLLVIEDAHWLDPTSLEVMRVIADRLGTIPVMVILSFRPPFSLAADDSRITHIPLAKLKPQEAIAVVESVAGDKALPPGLVEHIVARTGGVPLFVEELTKMVLGSGLAEQGTGRIGAGDAEPWNELPTTLQDSLMARLDQLGPVKRVAQMAAVIGQEFRADTLLAISDLSSDSLQGALSQLLKAELIVADSAAPLARFAFNHALVRDAAYNSLLNRDRRQFHSQVAAALEAQDEAGNPVAPELLAHHYSAAGRPQPALKFWRIATQQALQRSASVEAFHHTETAIKLLQAQPDTPERRRLELDFRLLAGSAAWAVKGFGAGEVEENFTRARELAAEVGDPAQVVIALRGLFGCYYARGELARAYAQAESVVALARENASSGDLMVGHMLCGSIRYWQGRFGDARRELDTALSLYDPAEQEGRLLSSQIDPGVNARLHLGWTLWCQGLPDQAIAVSDEGLEVARFIGQPFSLAMALFWNGAVRLDRGEIDEVEAAVEELSSVTARYQIAYLGDCAIVLRGAALIARGEPGAGVATIQRAFAAFRSQQAGLGLPWAMSLAAAGCLRAGLVKEALEIVAKALGIVQSNGEHQWEAELHRLKGACLAALLNADGEPAEASVRRAIEIARRQGARSLELRAATTLAQMAARRGDKDVHLLLEGIYSRFTEGFDTADVLAARRLLDAFWDRDLELGSGRGGTNDLRAV